MAELEINFQFVASAQSLKAEAREITTMGENFARIVTNEVALAASKDSFNRARRRFVSGIRQGILAEVSRMAMLIGKFFPLPDKYSGPHGQMSLTADRGGEMSATAKIFKFQPTFNRKDANIQWAKRNSRYLDWKERKGKGGKWWRFTGDLQKDLSSKNARFYEETFGPIRVRLVRPPPGRGADGRFTRAPNKTSGIALNPADAKAGDMDGRARVNVTAPGKRGKISADVTVGTLEVDTFGKITPSMLPALNGKTMNPALAEPATGVGLMKLWPDGETKDKLTKTPDGKRYRAAVEPFVSFFLTRAIPNSVWRRTESLIRGD